MNVLHKKLFRGLWRSRGQSIAVITVVLCGTACYIAVASAHSNLVLTRDTYYAQYRFADFELILERAPNSALFKLENIPGVQQVRGRIVKDVNLDVPGSEEPSIGRIISMPNKQQPVLNDVHLVSGKYFTDGAQNEVILSERFARENELKLGDIIYASIDTKKYPLRIVALGLSPEYVYMIRNIQEMIPSPETFAILWVPQDFADTALDLREASNNVVGRVDANANLDLILDLAEKSLESYGVIAKIKQEDQISNQFITSEIKELVVTGKVIPAIFQGVAALILSVLLNRMVRRERAEIGLLKAYGYSSAVLAWHYIEYALVLAVAGSVVGFGLGQWLSSALVKLYVEFFQFPIFRARVYPDVLARSIGVAILFAVSGAVLAARNAVRVHPAESMRPESPRYGRRTIFESIPRLWRWLSFSNKMIVRNVSRNTLRAMFTIFGIMLSTALLFLGFFVNDALDYMMDFQFNVVQREQMKISLVGERNRSALYDLARLEGVRRAEPLLEYPFELRNEWTSKDVAIIGIENGSYLQRLIDENNRPITIGETGLLLSRSLADDLRARVGDKVRLRSLTGKIEEERDAIVSQVVTQYLGSAAYMNIDALSRILNEPFSMNAALLSTVPGTENGINRGLKDVPGVAAVSIKETVRKNLTETFVQSMLFMNTMLVGFSGVIACAIVYNVTTVSLAERQRELASLRVLGFTQLEVGRVLYRENAALSVVGLLLGIPAGAAICWIITQQLHSDLFRIPFHIERVTYVYVTVLIILFVALANWAVHYKVRRLDIVEVLKERE